MKRFIDSSGQREMVQLQGGEREIPSFSIKKKKRKKESSIFLHIGDSNRHEKMREMFLKVIARGQGTVTTGRNDPRKIGS